MSSVNQWNVVGYAGKDCDMSYTPQGKAVSRFSIAVSEYAGTDGKGQPQYNTLWVNVVCWNTLAETANKLVEKGGLYFVSGRMALNNYTDKNGQKQVSVQLIASTVAPLAKPQDRKAGTTVTSEPLDELEEGF